MASSIASGLASGFNGISRDAKGLIAAIGTVLRTAAVHAAVHAADWRRRNQEIQQLRRFTDRELWDLGLSRSDILLIEKGLLRRE